MPDLVQIETPGGVKFTVAKDAADAFSGFLSDLESQGYKIDQGQSGGYNNRNIAGTNIPSQHAFGHAIDVNSAWNPRGANTDSDMPANVAALAAKHGLIWGGNWSGDTRDPMHFEFHPSGATKVADSVTWDSLGAGKSDTTTQPTPSAKPSAVPTPGWESLGAPTAPTPPPPTMSFEDYQLQGRDIPQGGPAAPTAPVSTGQSVWDWLRGVGAPTVAGIEQGWKTGVLTPEAEKRAESIPYAGPVLGFTSGAVGAGLGAVGGLTADALRTVAALGGRESAAVVESLPFIHSPNPFMPKPPMDIRGGIDYGISATQNALANRSVPLPSEFRAMPFTPEAGARMAAGPAPGETSATGVPPPTSGTGTMAPPPRERLSPGPDPEARSAGAAATPSGEIPEPTRAQAIANFEKSVNQSAEDRAGPAMVDNTPYVPNIPTRPLASRVFNARNALDEKIVRESSVDPNKYGPGATDQLNAINRDRNQGMVDLIRSRAGDANTLASLRDARRALAPDNFGAFEGEQPIPEKAAGLLKTVDDALDSPDAKTPAIKAALQQVRDSLFNSKGELETLPSRLYGALHNLHDLIDRGKGTGDEARKLSAATAILTRMEPDFQEAIGSGAPKYDAYRAAYRKASEPINRQEFLQKYTEGSQGKRLWGLDGYLIPNRVQGMMNDILQGMKQRGNGGLGQAKSLTDDELQDIINVRNELAASALRDKLAATRGSDTFQKINRSTERAMSPLGVAIRQGGLFGAQVVGEHLAGLSPEVRSALMFGQATVAPAVEAASKQRALARQKAQTQARTNELLQQGPRNPLYTP